MDSTTTNSPILSSAPLPSWKRTAFKWCKKPFFGRFERPWRWPANANPEQYVRFEVANPHGGKLHGLVRQTTLDPRGVVLLAHPLGTAAKGFFIKYGHVDLFLSAGYHCVLFDFNGFGESESTSFEFPDDLLAVAKCVRARFPQLPMAAIGISFGAMHAIGAGASPGCPFRVIVAEAVACSLAEYWKAFPVANVVLKILSRISPEGERKLRPQARIGDYEPGRSVLLIHATGDRYTPPSHGDAIAAAAPPHVEVERLVLHNSDHTHGLRDDTARYTEAVLAFLARKLS